MALPCTAVHLCDCIIVQPRQVTLCDIPTVAWLATRDQVVAVVELVVGVPGQDSNTSSTFTHQHHLTAHHSGCYQGTVAAAAPPPPCAGRVSRQVMQELPPPPPQPAASCAHHQLHNRPSSFQHLPFRAMAAHLQARHLHWYTAPGQTLKDWAWNSQAAPT